MTLPPEKTVFVALLSKTLLPAEPGCLIFRSEHVNQPVPMALHSLTAKTLIAKLPLNSSMEMQHPPMTLTHLILSNIKDRLTALLPKYQLVFRNGWEGYMENQDAYGNPEKISDSTETAIDGFHQPEKVSRIVVVYVNSAFNNYSPYGHEWVDENGEGVSALPGKTYKEVLKGLRR